MTFRVSFWKICKNILIEDFCLKKNDIQKTVFLKTSLSMSTAKLFWKSIQRSCIMRNISVDELKKRHFYPHWFYKQYKSGISKYYDVKIITSLKWSPNNHVYHLYYFQINYRCVYYKHAWISVSVDLNLIQRLSIQHLSQSWSWN